MDRHAVIGVLVLYGGYNLIYSVYKEHTLYAQTDPTQYAGLAALSFIGFIIVLFTGEAIAFKRVYLEPGSLDFSFSGLKTQALNYLNSEKQAGREINVNDVAASFQAAVVEVIADKAVDAAVRYDQKRIVMAGGVASNSRLRALISAKASARGIDVLKPSPVLCTDNGAMIASAAYYAYKSGERTDYELDAVPGLEF